MIHYHYTWQGQSLFIIHSLSVHLEGLASPCLVAVAYYSIRPMVSSLARHGLARTGIQDKGFVQ